MCVRVQVSALTSVRFSKRETSALCWRGAASLVSNPESPPHFLLAADTVSAAAATATCAPSRNTLV